ncbi:MAG: glycerate dehydrogenase, partial [Gemmatimonadetes bacterium]|nr:glycerate dehydrogenase [Gemmatimonadota bacterium]
MHAVFLDFGTVSNGDLDTGTLERVLPGLVIHEQTRPDQVAERIAGFEVVLANKAIIDRAAIASNAELKLIALTATGVDNVDIAAAREAGIAVCNLRDYCTPSVVQHVFAMLLALTHRLRDYDALVRAGGWEQAGQFSTFPYPIRELRDHVFGIVGH